MTAANKIRIYELAKEVKKEPKIVIEDARRYGIDVSVPSNSVPKEVADKIREKYDLGKKDAPTQKRAIVIFKKPKTEAAPVVETTEIEQPIVELIAAETIEQQPPVVVTPAEKPAQPKVFKSVTKKAVEAQQPIIVAPIEAKEIPAELPQVVKQPVVAEQPKVEVAAQTEQLPVVQTEQPPIAVAVAPKIEEVPAAVEKPAEVTKPKVFTPTSGIKQLTLTKKAIEAGHKHGEKINIPQPVQPKPAVTAQNNPQDARRGDQRVGNRFGNQQNQPPRPQFSGTPGEKAAPQMQYIPAGTNRGKPGRNQQKGGKNDRRGGRFDDRDALVPERLTIEQRLQHQVGTTQKPEAKYVRLVEGATVREFAEKLGIAPRDIVQLLIKRGIFATVNQPLNNEIATDLARGFGFEVTFVAYEEMVVEEEFEELIAAESDDEQVTRAPVVTVMGHVDHGKTSLLDGIRQANVAAGEAGGITQHIGAYSVQVTNPDNSEEKRRVVFLDTPGHEAFTMMRARGAKATDVVVLVVAADDGVMPQTIEAIEHSKAAKVPIIVAINKIDKAEANVDRVKQELSGHGLQPIEWGGETEMVEVSAKQQLNINSLLETILLTSDILELKASPTRRASGVVLEAKLDRGRGAVATVLVQQGTLHVGDPFIIGNYSGKVRAMFNDRGEAVTEAAPATPVEVLGLGGVPQAGDSMQVVVDIDRAQQISNQRQQAARNSALAQTSALGLESLGKAEIKELRVILKGDVQGSVEVIKSTLEKLSTEKVKVKVIRSGVGAITESDVLLASATQAEDRQTAVVIVGFNVRPESRATEVAKSERVDIRLHSIIYKLEEEIRAAMIGMLDAIEREIILGHALVLQVFKITRVGTIAGCRVLDGLIRRTAKARIIRDGVVAWEGEIDSLKRVKDDAAEVREGFECGIGLHRFNDVKVDDQIEAFWVESIAATEL